LYQYAGIRCVILNALEKFCSVKTAMHRTPGNFRGIFAAADAALLSQGKDNKAKSAEKSSVSGGMGRVLSPYSDIKF
jgi:hypothetical protein